jgi:signal transduction histidine kinase
MAGNGNEGDVERVAKSARTRIRNRIDILDTYIMRALDNSLDDHVCLEDLPEDMVIYKYVNDSLKSWSNQFSVLNDDISTKMVFQRLTNLKNRLVSPLIDVTEELSYMNLGPKWYLVKLVTGENNEKVIAGIEIKNTLIDDIQRNDNGINKRLNIPARYTVLPLNYSGGTAVSIDDKPLFKIICDSSSFAPFFTNSFLKWLGLIFLTLASILFLSGKRTIKNFLTVVGALTVMLVMAYVWGIQMDGTSAIFSPTTYAYGSIFFSLGALFLLNSYITLVCICTYLVSGVFLNWARKNKEHRKQRLKTYCLVLSAAIVAVIIYTHLTLESILLNSNISLELYRWNSNIPNTIGVYISYIGLLFCVILFLQMLSPAVRELYSIRYNILTIRNLGLCALCAATYFSITSGIIGFRREQDRVAVWANRLSVDRDLGLEIRLKTIEEEIANDKFISSLSRLNNAEGMILNRISETYLSRIRHDYSLGLKMLRKDNPDLIDYFNDIIRSGSPISEGSHFLFVTDDLGHNKYVGIFMFYSVDDGLTRMMLEIEPNSNRDDKGYYSILGKFSTPGDINIPSIYSYAKYSDGKLISYKGNYPYPTIFDHRGDSEGNDNVVLRDKKQTHFLHNVSDNELIIISRPKRNSMVYFTSFSYLFLVLMAIMYIFTTTQRKKTTARSNYFKARINTILFVSSTLILASLTIVSIFFVYKRNEENMRNLMSGRITTIQALVGSPAKGAKTYHDLQTPAFRTVLENISATTKSDITLYTPEGKVFYSTTPEVFDKMILGNRIDQDAYHNISHLNQRFFINREKISDYSYWVLYAPIFNNDREIVAIASSPYTAGDYDFRREAFFHAALLINLFLLLLILSLLFSTREVNHLFSPLIEMGKKMNTADIHNLETIKYSGEDEISSLVEAYNRMVKELADSTVRLAQAERDKAWSQMARQVAHEIKNPLTPIKLEIQRLIRLKEKGNPKWGEKFDQVSTVVLEHIDILTETANEFSTFAKLYSEEPVLIDLDKTLKDQLLIFDNKENINLQYIGMEGAMVMAPRPQLIRVFVNLITNAIQAVEIMQTEAVESGLESPKGHVLICLRNSTKEGCYDIVVDDNGPGVKDENLSKLFTPNFTTKSGGTGLGLAICRNIIEKCDGEITYRKSFGLGGASFTVTLPEFKS